MKKYHWILIIYVNYYYILSKLYLGAATHFWLKTCSNRVSPMSKTVKIQKNQWKPRPMR